MKYLVLVFALLAVQILMTGCSSTQTQPQYDARVSEAAYVYKKSIQSITMAEVKSDLCTKNAGKIKAQWNWKQAIEVADSCMKTRQFAMAEEIGNELSTREPAGPWGPYFLASVARERGELERALWMSELAMKRAHEVGILHYLRAQVLWDKKEYGAAVASFEKSTELDSSIVPAHLFLGQIYYRDQDYTAASKHFYAVLKIIPRHPIALSGLAESQLRENNVQGALDAYSRLADSYSNDGLYLARIGEIYETVLHDIPKALSAYRKLHGLIQSGRITKNSEISLDAKIKELELSTQEKRTLAASDEKGSQIK
ncbi:MAG: tetratricopeptide repeat protein [Oligoflexia bacterium]|nr:tetratricopeptide repeat protein [Oligoflexia bacterium]